ncbi:MAG: fasciclin domain-containing protein [Ardenticatenaceae bacterium]|nr:fasciclin domain-containing protein [Ardenticatenaceae bacterium]
MNRRVKLFALVCAMLLMAIAPSVFAADGIPREDLPNIVEIAVANDDFDTLVTAVTAAGLADTLSGEGPFTVFAPTDAAFAKLPAGTLNSLLADTDALTEVLLYHVVSGDIGSDIAKNVAASSGSVATVSGQSAQIKFFDGSLYLDDDSKVVSADILASNGKIHVIDTVLIPPSMRMAEVESSAAPVADATGQTIVDVAVNDDRFETLVTALTAADLVGTLSGEGPFTVFAPTDDAFAKLPAATLNALLADPSGGLTDVLLYHVVSGDVGSSSAKAIAADAGVATTVGGEQVRLKVFEGDIFLNDDSKVIIADIVTSNGVIHVIDTVLIPPSMGGASDGESTTETTAAAATGNTIVDIAVADGRFDTLVTAVTAAGLVGTLSGEGPFTVFAPTDDAFAKLPAGTLSALLADPNGALTDVLLYHVLSGEVGSEIAKVVVADTGRAVTVGGEVVNIKFFDGDLYLNDDSKIIIEDIVADNGVIHVIDTVLIPPSMAGNAE